MSIATESEGDGEPTEAHREGAVPVGVVLTQSEKQAELSKAREHFGACVTAPDLDRFE